MSASARSRVDSLPHDSLRHGVAAAQEAGRGAWPRRQLGGGALHEGGRAGGALLLAHYARAVHCPTGNNILWQVKNRAINKLR